MLLKRIHTLVAILIFATLTVAADNWIMTLSTENGWSIENETVSVTYMFDRNVTKVGGSLQPTSCEPKILAKIKNNTEEFIYIDLSKTYITRNGEAELYQNIVAMSSDAATKEDNNNNTKLSQNVMPIPPHASKTFSFPIFPSATASYDGHISFNSTYKYLMYENPKEVVYLDEVFEYNASNSPIIACIAFAYSTTEQGEKQAKLNKEFYVNFTAAVNNTKDKNFEEVLPDRDNYYWFTMQANTLFPKKKVEKAKKEKKDKDKSDKDKSKKK